MLREGASDAQRAGMPDPAGCELREQLLDQDPGARVKLGGSVGLLGPS
jgi:hypothetical protein